MIDIQCKQNRMTLLWVAMAVAPLVAQAEVDRYATAGIFGQVEHQGLTVTVSETAQLDTSGASVGAGADFVMADGCLFATGHSTQPIQFDIASARMKNVRASGDIVGYGYDFCHYNRPFQLTVRFEVDISPFHSDGRAMATLQRSVSQIDGTVITQNKDSDEMTARVDHASLTSTLTFDNSDYTFTHTVYPTAGTIGYLRDRRVQLNY